MLLVQQLGVDFARRQVLEAFAVEQFADLFLLGRAQRPWRRWPAAGSAGGAATAGTVGAGRARYRLLRGTASAAQAAATPCEAASSSAVWIMAARRSRSSAGQAALRVFFGPR